MNGESIRLEHAFLTIRDLEPALGFYRRVFPDWTIRWDGVSGEGNRWVHFGSASGPYSSYLSLCENRAAGEPGDAYTTVRIQHIGFSHPDVHGLERRLGLEGIRPADDIIDDGSYRRVYYLDPDGNELEFVQALQAAA